MCNRVVRNSSNLAAGVSHNLIREVVIRSIYTALLHWSIVSL